MKKLLTVSVFAIMAVSAANADIASTKYVDEQTGAENGVFAAGSFTNAAAAATNLKDAVNAIAGVVGSENVSAQIDSAIATAKVSDLSDGADYAKTENVVTKTDLGNLTAEENATAGQVVTGVTTTGGVVTAVTGSKITNDFIEDNTINQAKIKDLGTALEGKADKSNTYTKTETDGLLDGKVNKTDLASKTAAGIVKMSTEAADAKAESTDVTLSGSAIRTAIDDSISDLSTEVSGKQDKLTAGDYVKIDNNVITTTYIGTDTVAITKNAEGKGELSVQNGSIGEGQLDSNVNADIAKGVTAHAAVTVQEITDGNPDGMYALTAKVVDGVVSGYSWELIGR